MGNVLDHGGGHLGARFDDLLGVEVALGNGETVRTGLWHLRESGDLIQHYPPGLGPDLRGLFVQSSFGIVTKMVLRLHPARPFRELTLEAAEARLPRVVDALRQAREDGVITGYVRVTDGIDPHIRFFRRDTGATWKAQITLYGTSAIRAEAGRELRRRMNALVLRTDGFDTEHDDPRARDGEDRALLEARLRLAQGIPSDRSLENIARSAGKSFPPGTAGLDHDRDLPGFLCANVTLPFSGAHVAACVAEVRAAADEARHHGRVSVRHDRPHRPVRLLPLLLRPAQPRCGVARPRPAERTAPTAGGSRHLSDAAGRRLGRPVHRAHRRRLLAHRLRAQAGAGSGRRHHRPLHPAPADPRAPTGHA
ncbi:hypothetical protein ACQ4WX_07145 [Streptomyces lasalocidi]